ncbi:type IV pilus assembly protein PilN [Sedimentibacter acidaminivorans]|uniref:Type IV pilus assembly protein PilN n=1 Tax=Sedimentibacter acidaminivorans TaxID=913099 RepID=A0ABS4GIZ9_9FIRM|nr:PilN domain-containing protein [Sedimentibacter acidaminivorans]MBP1927330.1 type IV pilus assembly protein PilN [Sedimentibacter acidaminivorans]
MSDLNFFEPYIEKREFKFNRMVLLNTVLVLCIAGFAAKGVYNQFHIFMLQGQVEGKLEVSQDPKTVKKYNEIKDLEYEMTVFKEEVDRIIKMDKNIAKTDIVSEELITEIKSKMPADLFMTNFSVSGRKMQISGIAKDSYSIAEFSKSLKVVKDVESVFLSSINNNKEEGNYSFVLNTTFKEVNIDEQEIPNQ